MTETPDAAPVPTDCTASARCKQVAAGRECLHCGGQGTGIAGAAAYRPVSSDLDRCDVCGAPITWAARRWTEPLDGSGIGLRVRRACAEHAKAGVIS